MRALRPPCRYGLFRNFECGPWAAETLGFVKLCELNALGLERSRKSLGLHVRRSNLLKPIKAKDEHGASLIHDFDRTPECHGPSSDIVKTSNGFKSNKAKEDPDSPLTNNRAAFSGTIFYFRFS